MEECNYIVYMHICPNNKKYIGITKNKPNKRWGYGHNYKSSILFNKAINKYGWENIKHKILYENLSKEEAEQKEIELIAYYKSNQSKFGYNIANGGHIHSVSEETKKKLSQSLKGKHNSPKTEFKKGQIGEGLRKGIKLSEETKQKISNSKKGKKIKNTENYKKRCGNKNPFYGKTHTIEVRKLISKLKKGTISTKRKPIICIETSKKYDCISDAAKEFNTTITSISRACSGQRKTFKKMHWKFL